MGEAYNENAKTFSKIAKFAEALGPLGDLVAFCTFFLPDATEAAFNELNEKLDTYHTESMNRLDSIS